MLVAVHSTTASHSHLSAARSRSGESVLSAGFGGSSSTSRLRTAYHVTPTGGGSSSSSVALIDCRFSAAASPSSSSSRGRGVVGAPPPLAQQLSCDLFATTTEEIFIAIAQPLLHVIAVPDRAREAFLIIDGDIENALGCSGLPLRCARWLFSQHTVRRVEATTVAVPHSNASCCSTPDAGPSASTSFPPSPPGALVDVSPASGTTSSAVEGEHPRALDPCGAGDDEAAVQVVTDGMEETTHIAGARCTTWRSVQDCRQALARLQSLVVAAPRERRCSGRYAHLVVSLTITFAHPDPEEEEKDDEEVNEGNGAGQETSELNEFQSQVHFVLLSSRRCEADGSRQELRRRASSVASLSVPPQQTYSSSRASIPPLITLLEPALLGQQPGAWVACFTDTNPTVNNVQRHAEAAGSALPLAQQQDWVDQSYAEALSTFRLAQAVSAARTAVQQRHSTSVRSSCVTSAGEEEEETDGMAEFAAADGIGPSQRPRLMSGAPSNEAGRRSFRDDPAGQTRGEELRLKVSSRPAAARASVCPACGHRPSQDSDGGGPRGGGGGEDVVAPSAALQAIQAELQEVVRERDEYRELLRQAELEYQRLAQRMKAAEASAAPPSTSRTRSSPPPAATKRSTSSTAPSSRYLPGDSQQEQEQEDVTDVADAAARAGEDSNGPACQREHRSTWEGTVHPKGDWRPGPRTTRAELPSHNTNNSSSRRHQGRSGMDAVTASMLAAAKEYAPASSAAAAVAAAISSSAALLSERRAACLEELRALQRRESSTITGVVARRGKLRSLNRTSLTSRAAGPHSGAAAAPPPPPPPPPSFVLRAAAPSSSSSLVYENRPDGGAAAPPDSHLSPQQSTAEYTPTWAAEKDFGRRSREWMRGGDETTNAGAVQSTVWASLEGVLQRRSALQRELERRQEHHGVAQREAVAEDDAGAFSGEEEVEEEAVDHSCATTPSGVSVSSYQMIMEEPQRTPRLQRAAPRSTCTERSPPHLSEARSTSCLQGIQHIHQLMQRPYQLQWKERQTVVRKEIQSYRSPRQAATAVDRAHRPAAASAAYSQGEHKRTPIRYDDEDTSQRPIRARTPIGGGQPPPQQTSSTPVDCSSFAASTPATSHMCAPSEVRQDVGVSSCRRCRRDPPPATTAWRSPATGQVDTHEEMEPVQTTVRRHSDHPIPAADEDAPSPTRPPTPPSSNNSTTTPATSSRLSFEAYMMQEPRYQLRRSSVVPRQAQRR